MLFTNPDLERIIGLHELSYDLFQWMNSVLSTGGLRFDVIHSATDSAESATEWIERHRRSLPTAIRERLSETKSVANLLVSFLTTSFELNPKAKVVPVGRMCCCGWCGWATKLNHLVSRHPSQRDFKTADEMKLMHLAQMAAEMKSELSASQRELFNRNPSLSHELAHVTYARELVRRTEFASQGTGVLALWRTIAWRDHKLIPSFRLTVNRILEAQFVVTSVLQAGELN